MKHIVMGSDLMLPVDAATEPIAAIGQRKGGKTYGVGKLLEGLLDAYVQVVGIDQAGKLYGLRLAADGKTPSRYDIVILGGLRGDAPLTPESGALCAEVFVSSGRSMVFGTLAGLSSSSGTFSDYISALKQKPLIDDDGSTLGITEAGLAAAGPVSQVPDSPEELLALWLPKFKRGARAMLQALVTEGPLSREALGEAAARHGAATALSHGSGTFSDYLSALRRNGLIEESGGLVSVVEELRPYANGAVAHG